MLITEVAKESVNSIDRNLGERTRLFSNLIVLLLPEDEGVYEEEEPSISITSKSGSPIVVNNITQCLAMKSKMQSQVRLKIKIYGALG